MKATVFLLAAVSMTAVSQANATTFPVPQWKEGQHVYVVPEGWQPPMFGPRDLAELEQAASALKYPFYVVIAKQLSGGGDGDQIAAEAVDGIAQTWAQQAAGYDVGTSQVFLLSFEPRKYRFLVGKRWGTELGFERNAHKPHTQLFERSVRGTPKDPKGGMIAMMRSVDAYLVDQTDPVKIAARKKAAELASARQALDGQANALAGLLASGGAVLPEQTSSYQELLSEAQRIRRSDDPAHIRRFADDMAPEVGTLRAYVTRRQQEVKRLEDARGALDGQILALSGLLSSDAELLPEDASSYRDLLAKAKDIRAKDDPEVMTAFAAGMAKSVGVLDGYVEERRIEERGKTILLLAKLAVLLALLVLALVLIVRRAKKFATLRTTLDDALSAWKERVSNASSRYLAFHGELKGMTSYLELEGETKALSDAVASEVNEIFYAVKAMESHVQRCGLQAGKAGFWDLKPLEKAIADIGGPFQFDTGVVDTTTLFGGETKVISIDPATFVEQLEERFKTSMASWQRLKTATELWNVPAKRLFPQDALDVMFTGCKERDIPLQWLSDHPLFGDDAADQAIYDRLDAANAKDPVAFSRQLEELKGAERKVQERYKLLCEAVDAVTKERTDSPPTDHGIVLDPDDDPLVAYGRAKMLENDLAGVLAARRSVTEVQQKAGATGEAYVECREKAAKVANAKQAVEQADTLARSAKGRADEVFVNATAAVGGARRVHKTVDTDALMVAGRERSTEGDDAYTAAADLRGERRLIDAARRYAQATASFEAGAQSFQKAIGICKALDAKKAEYERQRAGMASFHGKIEGSIRRHGGSSSRLSSFSAPTIAGPADYTVLLAALLATQRSWEQEEHRIRQAYEAEQERIRQEAARRRREEEARRRRQREEEERRARARRNSSSGGGWGGGGSSSSGGSWGGGGSSSSGGSW